MQLYESGPDRGAHRWRVVAHDQRLDDAAEYPVLDPPGPCQTNGGGLPVPLFGPPNVDKLIAKGDLPGLIDALGYPNPWRVRRDAAVALGEFGDADAVEPLIEALGDDNASVRLAAAAALGKIADPGALEPLIGALASPAVEIRKAAADSLGQLGDPRALDPLIVCLKDASWSVRRAAAEALGRIGDSGAAEALEIAFQDGDANVRRAAAVSLGALGWRPKGPVDGSAEETTPAGQG